MSPPRIAFVWESFGPPHRDRLGAAAAAGFEVIGIEFNQSSPVYRWERGGEDGIPIISLFDCAKPPGGFTMTVRLIRALLASRADAVFLCHYHYAPVFLAALVLRLAGRRVYTMIDSKFDDYPRRIGREWIKIMLLSPYQGAIAASRRSRDYLHFLGFVRRPVVPGFDTLDLSRLRAAEAGARDLPHAERDFLIVARLVPKKNIDFALRAFAQHQAQARHPRKLRIVGYGDQESALRDLTGELGLAGKVEFTGWLDSAAVARAMREALCLILPSSEEQYGLVVAEALAQGLPVIVSSNAGAVDELIDNGVNGWIIDPYRPAGLEAALHLFDQDEPAWRSVSQAAAASSHRADVRHFSDAVRQLVSEDGRR